MNIALKLLLYVCHCMYFCFYIINSIENTLFARFVTVEK